MNRKITLISIFVVILISGCVTKSSFEDKINFEIVEKYTESFDGPHLFLSVETQKNYPCYGGKFKSNVVIKGSLIKIVLGEIKIPKGICPMMSAPAGFHEELNLIPGSYSLELHSKTKIDKYSVHVTTDKIVIENIDVSFSNVTQKTINRMPEDLLWIECRWIGGRSKRPKDTLCQDLFVDIEKIATPYMLAQNGIPILQFYKYDGTDERLIQLIEKYGHSGYSVKISTGKGKRFIYPRVKNMRPEDPMVAFIPNLEPKYYELITNLSICEDPYDFWCYVDVAINTNNESICNLVRSKNQGQCFGILGEAKLDENLCAKTGSCWTCKEDCYTYVAIRKNNPELCEELSSHYRDDCFRAFAEEFNDVSYCEKVKQPGRKEWCLDKFS